MKKINYKSAYLLHIELFSEEYDGMFLEKDGWSQEHTAKLNHN